MKVFLVQMAPKSKNSSLVCVGLFKDLNAGAAASG